MREVLGEAAEPGNDRADAIQLRLAGLEVGRGPEMLPQVPERDRVAEGEAGRGLDRLGRAERPLAGRAGQRGHQQKTALDRVAKPLGVGVDVLRQHVEPRAPELGDVRSGSVDGGGDPIVTIAPQAVSGELNRRSTPPAGRGPRVLGAFLGLGRGRGRGLGTGRRARRDQLRRDRRDGQLVQENFRLSLAAEQVDDQAVQVRPLQAHRPLGRGPEHARLTLGRLAQAGQLQPLPALDVLVDRPRNEDV